MSADIKFIDRDKADRQDTQSVKVHAYWDESWRPVGFYDDQNHLDVAPRESRKKKIKR